MVELGAPLEIVSHDEDEFARFVFIERGESDIEVVFQKLSIILAADQAVVTDVELLDVVRDLFQTLGNAEQVLGLEVTVTDVEDVDVGVVVNEVLHCLHGLIACEINVRELQSLQVSALLAQVLDQLPALLRAKA